MSNENVINAVQNRPLLWDTAVNAPEEEIDLAWKEIADSFGVAHGYNFITNFLLLDVFSVPLNLANITQVQAIRTSSSSAMLTYVGRVEGK